MVNDKKDRIPTDATSPSLSRRDFIAFATGFAATATGTAWGREQRVIETDVDVKTPDGICDAVFTHPAKGSAENKRDAERAWRKLVTLYKQAL